MLDVDNPTMSLVAGASDADLHAAAVDEVPPPLLARRTTDVDHQPCLLAGALHGQRDTAARDASDEPQLAQPAEEAADR